MQIRRNRRRVSPLNRQRNRGPAKASRRAYSMNLALERPHDIGRDPSAIELTRLWHNKLIPHVTAIHAGCVEA